MKRGDERIELPCELSGFEQEEINKFKDYIERMKDEDVEGSPAPKLINTIKVKDAEGFQSVFVEHVSANHFRRLFHELA